MKIIGLFLGLLFAFAAFFVMKGFGQASAPSFTIAVAVLCAYWWVTETIPIAVTSLIPLSLFPMTGVLSKADVSGAFGNPINFLLLGGFILSLALSKNGAHLRLAAGVIGLIKPKTDRQLVLAIMAAAAALSMWISNAATVLMLLPVALAVLDARQKQGAGGALTVPLLLGLCYAASIGGMGTPIGTPPNLIFIGMYEQASGATVSFLQWMGWAIPAVLCLLPAAAWVLTRNVKGGDGYEMEDLGRWRPAEIRILAIFVVTAVLWMTRADPFGGWSVWLDLPNAHDGHVALLAAVLVFTLPGDKGEPLLHWSDAQKLPWGVILLIAGGLALSTALKNAGLTDALAAQLGALSMLPLLFVIFSICIAVTFVTEFTSNSASTALLLPVLAAAAVASGMDPINMMLPATLSASCAFMTPMATAPNAIVFGSERISIRSMVRHGIILNVLCALIITGLMAVFLNA